jgi:K+-transporting ATPase c subunit
MKGPTTPELQGSGAGFLGLSPQEYARIDAENKAAEASKRARAANPWLDKRVKASEAVIKGQTPKSQAPKPDYNLVSISSGIDRLVELQEEQNKTKPIAIEGAGL